jgi:hypothetical protein
MRLFHGGAIVTRSRKIVAEVWARPKLDIPHSKPYSRHTDVERAKAMIRNARLRYPNAEPDYFVLLVLNASSSEFEPMEVQS